MLDNGIREMLLACALPILHYLSFRLATYLNKKFTVRQYAMFHQQWPHTCRACHRPGLHQEPTLVTGPSRPGLRKSTLVRSHNDKVT